MSHHEWATLLSMANHGIQTMVDDCFPPEKGFVFEKIDKILPSVETLADTLLNDQIEHLEVCPKIAAEVLAAAAILVEKLRRLARGS